MNNAFKKTVISGLTLAMLAGGASAAFADGRGKDKDRDKDRDKDLKVIQTQWNNKEANVNLNIRLTFDDLKGKDVEWAQRYIASLASKRVFEGYEDGTFKPRQTISRIEAITAAVRLMGLRDQAESADAKASNLNFKDADKIKQKYPWAVGYVAVALQNDLFTENDDAVQPEKEADRLWATTLLVKALKLQDEAKSKMNAKLPFADADKIPAGSVGYVAVALEHKLIDGYDDNTFRPNKPVTRAELAALLDRTGTQLPDQTSVKGEVTGAVANNLLPIKTANNAAINVELDPNVFVFRNGAHATAADLQTGDQVLIRSYGGKAIYVEVLTPANQQPSQQTDFSVTGTLNSYQLNAQGRIGSISINQAVSTGVQTAVYSVDSSKLYISGDISLLTPGRTVELRGNNQLVNTIIIR